MNKSKNAESKIFSIILTSVRSYLGITAADEVENRVSLDPDVEIYVVVRDIINP